MSILRCLVALLLCVAGSLTLAQVPAAAGQPQSQPQAITVVLDDNYPPYIFRDNQGQLQGILKDSWELWQQRTGVTVHLEAMHWAAAQALMQGGQADVIDTLFKTEARQQLYDFSRPYAKLPVDIYFHSSIGGIVDADSLRGFTVGVKEGDSCVDELRKHGVDGLKTFSSYSAVVTAAQAGDVRVFCMDEPPAVYLLAQQGLAKDFRHTKPIGHGEFHRAVRKGNTELLRLVEDGFSRITASEHQQIEEKWLGSPVHELMGGPYVRYGSIGILLMSLLAVALALWNQQLRRRVQEKTQSLTASMAELDEARRVSEQARAQLEATMRALPDLLFEFDIEGRYLSVQTTQSVWLYAPAQKLLGKRISEVLPAAAAEVVMAALHEAQERGLSTGRQYALDLPTGSMWFELSVARKETPPGELQRFITIAHDITARKQVQARVEQVLLEQQTMLDNDLVGIVKTKDRTILWANRAFSTQSGYPNEELVGASVRQHYASEHAYQSLGAEAYPLMATGKIYRSQTEFRHKDGSSVWLDIRGIRLSPESGESLWIFLDISERIRSQGLRDEALERLQKLADRVPGMLYQFSMQPDGRTSIPYTSDAIVDVFGLSPHQVQDHASALFARIHPDDLAGVGASIQASRTALTPWQHEFRVKHDGGSERWLFGNSMPERQSDGVVIWSGFVTDVTERKAAEQHLRQLSRAVEQAPMTIVIADLQGIIQYTNPYFTVSTGYAAHEVAGENPRILQSGLTPPEVYRDMWETLSSGGIWDGEFHNRKKNGERYIEHAVIAPVLDVAGKTTHYVALKLDITERKQDELALQTSLKEKVALLNEVHHRVKNNLQVITSLLRLEAGRSAQPDTKVVLKDMQGRIHTMALLHESLYRSGTFAAVDLSAYIRQLATQTFRAQEGRGGAVRLVLELAVVSVGMDQATPCGLLVNELLSNCLKHGFPDGRPGEVRVSLQATGDAGLWCLSVQDTGVGLPADFEARRAQSLGLQLVSDLARQLHGTLEIGAGETGGAAFSVVFPVQVFPLPD